MSITKSLKGKIKIVTSVEDIRIVDLVEYKIGKLYNKYTVDYTLGHVITWFTELPIYNKYIKELSTMKIKAKIMTGYDNIDGDEIETRHEILIME